MLVEWPDRLGPLTPADALRVTLRLMPGFDGDAPRRVTLAGWPDRPALAA